MYFVSFFLIEDAKFGSNWISENLQLARFVRGEVLTLSQVVFLFFSFLFCLFQFALSCVTCYIFIIIIVWIRHLSGMSNCIRNTSTSMFFHSTMVSMFWKDFLKLPRERIRTSLSRVVLVVAQGMVIRTPWNGGRWLRPLNVPGLGP